MMDRNTCQVLYFVHGEQGWPSSLVHAPRIIAKRNQFPVIKSQGMYLLDPPGMQGTPCVRVRIRLHITATCPNDNGEEKGNY